MLSPINKSPTSDGQRCYQIQQQRMHMGEQVMWDDAKGNPTKEPLGALGFVHNNKCVEIHMITAIGPSTAWYTTKQNSDRNVLMLTPLLLTIDWPTWLGLGGAKAVKGTQLAKGCHTELSRFLMEKLGHLQYCEETSELFV